MVRLKGGDPGIFGRAGEEIEACRAAGIPVSIVPGISAAQGAAASLGVSLTHRDHAQAVTFVTAQAKPGGVDAVARGDAEHLLDDVDAGDFLDDLGDAGNELFLGGSHCVVPFVVLVNVNSGTSLARGH